MLDGADAGRRSTPMASSTIFGERFTRAMI
jgi:hypothetical protein